jgi:hypothetical protein
VDALVRNPDCPDWLKSAVGGVERRAVKYITSGQCPFGQRRRKERLFEKYREAATLGPHNKVFAKGESLRTDGIGCPGPFFDCNSSASINANVFPVPGPATTRRGVPGNATMLK